MIEIITSQAIAFSFPIKPNFSTVLPFRLIKPLSKFVSLDIESIILFLYFDTFGCSQIKLISKLCKIKKGQINIKGKTAEKLGVIGKEKAIACEVISSVFKYE